MNIAEIDYHEQRIREGDKKVISADVFLRLLRAHRDVLTAGECKDSAELIESLKSIPRPFERHEGRPIEMYFTNVK